MWLGILFLAGGCAGGKVLYSSFYMTSNAADRGAETEQAVHAVVVQDEPAPAKAAVVTNADTQTVKHGTDDGNKPKEKNDNAAELPTGGAKPVERSEKGAAESNKAPETGHKKNVKPIALTFDDGPDTKYTPQILDILKEHQVKATFFLVGKQIELHPDIVKRIVNEGHAIGNHSWGHRQLNKLTTEEIKQDLDKTDQLLKSILGEAPVMFRAPYGAVSKTLIDEVKSSGREMVNWSVDTRDWAGVSPDEMMETVRKQMKPGGIVLMHSFGGKNGSLDNTVKLLPKLIGELQEGGYSLVTVPELHPSKP
ncbi:polysaccharide deacetylase family protein [Paenibacillus sp. MBLB4367]|uniref:polysaccharide deacetylase family protein n=1 Tax=Paenibacillus sp. MBLB4367 TaxID=3384767 RepID=UPI003907EB82